MSRSESSSQSLAYLPPEGLQMFVKVVTLGGFTRAAEQLQVPKARVSTAVQQLEARLGTRLLHRTTRRVQPTHDGLVLFERAQSVLDELQGLQGLFQAGDQPVSGRLRVDLPVGLACRGVIPKLSSLLKLHPQLEVELSCTDRRVDLVREGFDCVLRIGPVGEGGFVARRIGELEQVNCASPAYLRRVGKPKSLADLARHQLVHYAVQFGGPPDGWEYHDGQGWQTQPMAGVLTVNSSSAYETAGLAGLGLIQAPRVGLQSWLDQGLLVEVLPQYRARPLPVSLLYASRRHQPQRLQVFLAWLEKTLRPHLQRPAAAA
jgi:DNA-binding transcriptional LysR family regulator